MFQWATEPELGLRLYDLIGCSLFAAGISLLGQALTVDMEIILCIVAGMFIVPSKILRNLIINMPKGSRKEVIESDFKRIFGDISPRFILAQ